LNGDRFIAEGEPMSVLVGGIEAGGTKFVCALGTGPNDVRDEIRYPTTTPTETISRAVDYFREAQDRYGQLAAIGVASFGPVDPNPASPTFGYITSTPKPGWRDTEFAGVLRRELGLPVGFDTDVNVAALGEATWGAAQGLDSFLYLTIGTGIGGGGLMGGRLMHGLLHPEMGHIRVPHDWTADPFPGVCPFHGDCLEGLATGPAIESRWGRPAVELEPDHPAWNLESQYLAFALVNFICTLSPQRIILGGGVMDQTQLFPLIRTKVQELLADYIRAEAIVSEIGQYIVPPGLGNQSGVLGAIALAQLQIGAGAT
jgi:fructokinase